MELLPNFARLDRMPPYVFAKVNDLKMKFRHDGVGGLIWAWEFFSILIMLYLN